jgi:rRNA small subunit pseudouridine methyltransferase Nep1
MGLSHRTPEVVDVFKYVQKLPDDRPIVFVVGAFAYGKVDVAYVDTEISISQFPLSAAQVLTRLTNACEQRWDIV